MRLKNDQLHINERVLYICSSNCLLFCVYGIQFTSEVELNASWSRRVYICPLNQQSMTPYNLTLWTNLWEDYNNRRKLLLLYSCSGISHKHEFIGRGQLCRNVTTVSIPPIEIPARKRIHVIDNVPESMNIQWLGILITRIYDNI